MLSKTLLQTVFRRFCPLGSKYKEGVYFPFLFALDQGIDCRSGAQHLNSVPRDLPHVLCLSFVEFTVWLELNVEHFNYKAITLLN